MTWLPAQEERSCACRNCRRNTMRFAMNSMNMNIERIPRTVNFGGEVVQVEELVTRLPFARKPADLSEVGGQGRTKVYVTETKQLTAREFDELAASLLKSRDWLSGKGGGTDDAYFCVEVKAPGRPCLYINPEGGDYGRYVARLG